VSQHSVITWLLISIPENPRTTRVGIFPQLGFFYFRQAPILVRRKTRPLPIWEARWGEIIKPEGAGKKSSKAHHVSQLSAEKMQAAVP